MALHIEDTGQNMALTIRPIGTNEAELMVYSITGELIKKVHLPARQCQLMAQALLAYSNTYHQDQK